jgi:hypothetical protein
MCLRGAPEKYIAGAKAPAGAALDRAGLDVMEKWKYLSFFRELTTHRPALSPVVVPTKLSWFPLGSSSLQSVTKT